MAIPHLLRSEWKQEKKEEEEDDDPESNPRSYAFWVCFPFISIFFCCFCCDESLIPFQALKSEVEEESPHPTNPEAGIWKSDLVLLWYEPSKLNPTTFSVNGCLQLWLDPSLRELYLLLSLFFFSACRTNGIKPSIILWSDYPFWWEIFNRFSSLLIDWIFGR